eukprot:gnl/Chilomastix_cuspidata/863.p1 GENE.gnl/Chilomastix_cuspidata/863~~gnl/Chilomastix_cuspidata/863.p1  ORF type:complete len:445 (+),score=106.69 gnl/Chilomastix_cuspidata/863:29-1363(+)
MLSCTPSLCSHVRASCARFCNMPQSPVVEGVDVKLEYNDLVYLDSQATTPMDPRVLDAMLPMLTDLYGNPHSTTHAFGYQANYVVEEARKSVADLIGAEPEEIIFTSGATEANNIALKGLAGFYGESGRRHIITLPTEHKCVLETCRDLSAAGFDLSFAPVHEDGLVDLDALEALLASRPDTLFVSAMAVNNEIGVIQPLEQIGRLCKRHGAFFHCDAAQAAGKIPLDVRQIGADLMSLSAHKMYGPKGVGALFVSRARPRVRLKPLLSGGGQERGLRPGTLPAPLLAGFGEAARVARRELARDGAHVKRLYTRLHDALFSRLPALTLNGSAESRYAGNLNISFACVEGESLMMGLRGKVAVSSGSACTSASLEPSYVLHALGVPPELAHTSIRFGLGRFTTEDDVDAAAESVASAVEQLRERSPLWEMHQAGIDLSQVTWANH